MSKPKLLLLPLSTCRACRSRTIRSFTAACLDAGPARPSTPSPRFRLPVVARSCSASIASSSSFSTTARPHEGEEKPPPTPQGSDSTSISVPSSSNSSNSSSGGSNDTLPWYLQIDPPTPPSQPLSPSSHPLLLPSLPPNPPPILSPTLTYLSDTAGLDALTLLDLRTLNPPPALGGNLLMILATARSIKHLNVSADRFCRWLRSHHALRPHADGLLGRNELKIKLRRKSRRAKVLAAAGSAGPEGGGGLGSDDGITTGWICVNVGLVEEGTDENALGGAESSSVHADQAVSGLDDTEIRTEAELDNVVESESLQEAQEAQAEEDEAIANQAIQDEDRLEDHIEEDDDDGDDDDGKEVIEIQNNYIGFGSRPTAPRIVVQMFTEDKRAEVDLEGLWHDRATRRTRRIEKRREEGGRGGRRGG